MWSSEPEPSGKGTESPSFPQEGAGKKVLVIDDEEAILQMVKDILTNQGYAVDVARDGESALRPCGRMLTIWRCAIGKCQV